MKITKEALIKIIEEEINEMAKGRFPGRWSPMAQAAHQKHYKSPRRHRGEPMEPVSDKEYAAIMDQAQLSALKTTISLFGAGSIILHFLDMNFTILSWIDNWGNTIGWGIRIALVVIGVILFIIGGTDDETETAE